MPFPNNRIFALRHFVQRVSHGAQNFSQVKIIKHIS